MFDCSICLDTLKDPLVVSCGHTFCKCCLLQVKAKECPVCRSSIPSIETLPKNWILINLMDQLKNKKPKQIICGNCETSSATIFCENCDFNLCDDCNNNEHKTKISMKHVRVPLKEIKKKKFAFCSVHREEMKYYCKDEGVSLCHGCAVDNHKGHNYVSSQKFSTERRETLKETLNSLNFENIFDKETQSLVKKTRRNSKRNFRCREQIEIIISK
uniref:RING-type domain-containing protein n=1 Tax=Arcella intermedia TaxID=1963864 RepID=A0A6B2LIT0_9EUKA